MRNDTVLNRRRGGMAVDTTAKIMHAVFDGESI